jgi:major type 1 subunit fimbrin (pilin)
MKKTIVAVMVAASSVISAQALALNTAEVTILGEVNDSTTSCVVTPTGTLNKGIVRLHTVTTKEVTDQAVNTLFKSQKFGFEVKDCAKGASPAVNVNSIVVAVSGTAGPVNNILANTADNGAAGVGIGIENFKDSTRLVVDGTGSVTTPYTSTKPTYVDFLAGYVKINDTTAVTQGPVKSVATFTIDYTTN